MILTNAEIINYLRNTNLIVFHSPECIKNCSYKVRIGQIIEPQSGNILKLNGEGYLLKPSEVIMIKSKEKFNIPDELTASYTASFSISSKGILLINASMIEPGYSGYLSAVLLNFSAQPISISLDQQIAKVNFFKLDQSSVPMIPEIIDDIKYINNLKENATRYHKSFLNVLGLEKSILDKVFQKTRSLLTASGVIIFMLILFATIEPFTSKWIWEKTGVSTTTERSNLELVLKELKQTKDDINNSKKEIEKTYKDYNKLIHLQQQMDSIKNSIKKSKNND